MPDLFFWQLNAPIHEHERGVQGVYLRIYECVEQLSTALHDVHASEGHAGSEHDHDYALLKILLET
jgi:hypothetical protein